MKVGLVFVVGVVFIGVIGGFVVLVVVGVIGGFMGIVGLGGVVFFLGIFWMNGVFVGVLFGVFGVCMMVSVVILFFECLWLMKLG